MDIEYADVEAEAATIQVEEWERSKDGTTGSFLDAAIDR